MKPLEHNGKKFTNADAWRTAKATTSPKGEPALHEPDGMFNEEQPEPSQVVAEHGPAHEVHITHEHEVGAHHVHSVHADGHKHHSDHGSAEEAHEHAKNLAVDDANNERPEGEEEDGWDK